MQFCLDTIIKQQNHEHYLNLQMDPLGDLRATRAMDMGCDIAIVRYPTWWFGCLDNPDRRFGNSSVPTYIQSRNNTLEPLLAQQVSKWYPE